MNRSPLYSGLPDFPGPLTPRWRRADAPGHRRRAVSLPGWRSLLQSLGTVLGALILAVPRNLGADSTVGADAAAPLPAVDFILEQILAGAAKESEQDAQFAAHYSFVRWKEQSDCDANGKILETSLKRSTNVPPRIPEPAVLSGSIESTSSGSELHLDSGNRARGRAFDKKDFAVSADLLGKFQFTLVGREWYQDRPVLVLDFAPKPGPLPTHHLKDRFINQAAGRVWVDENTWLLAKGDLHLTAPVKVVGGLVGSVKAMEYHFERTITPEGWWYTRAVDWELVGRAVIQRKHIRYHEGRTNVVRVW